MTFAADAGASSAQTASPDEPAPLPEVTVTAPRPPTPRELAGEAVPDFIAAHAMPSTVTHQLPRWRIGICPLTQGLSPAFNAFITARIESVAAAVGAPIGGASCQTNVNIVFTRQPEQLLDEILKKDARLLGFHYSQQAKRLAIFSHPVQGWYVTSTRNYRGLETLDEPNPLPSLPGIFNAGHVPPGDLASRLANGRMSLIVHAVIVVDAHQVTGLAVGALSDFLAMLALSQAQSPDTCGQLPSIMDLLASRCTATDKPAQVTAGDIAFLRALYSADLEQSLQLETSGIRNSMTQQFDDH